jgi:site-specific DNA-adenine methylase
MTCYQGGKKRIGKTIAEIIGEVADLLEEDGSSIRGYCEPFVGMAGVYCHIPQLLNSDLSYLAGDVNGELIDMWKAAQRGWRPPIKCSKGEYERLKKSRSRSPRRTFIGYACDFRGKFFGGSFSSEKNVAHQANNVARCGAAMRRVKFYHGSYEQFSDLKGYIIYCDPPYANTDGYRNMGAFDHAKFWKWCRMMAENNVVLVSEFSAPKNAATLLYQDRREKLFIVQ